VGGKKKGSRSISSRAITIKNYFWNNAIREILIVKFGLPTKMLPIGRVVEGLQEKGRRQLPGVFCGSFVTLGRTKLSFWKTILQTPEGICTGTVRVRTWSSILLNTDPGSGKSDG